MTEMNFYLLLFGVSLKLMETDLKARAERRKKNVGIEDLGCGLIHTEPGELETGTPLLLNEAFPNVLKSELEIKMPVVDAKSIEV